MVVRRGGRLTVEVEWPQRVRGEGKQRTMIGVMGWVAIVAAEPLSSIAVS